MKKVSRYAPSPTGPLHFGNLRTALLAWLQARLCDAQFILRIEDLDRPRVKPDSVRQIMDDLLWLGLDWDQGAAPDGGLDRFYQSTRTVLYQDVLQRLYTKGLIYPCFCSRKDIRQACSAPHGKTPVYPGTCKGRYPHITPTSEQAVNGRLPSWRFEVADQVIEFQDVLMGHFSQHLVSEVGDFVVRRNDGLFAYQLAVVTDDIEMAVSDVLRGADLLNSTCRQIALYKALDALTPAFWHVKLMHDETGQRMSKRDGSDSLGQLRAQGMTAESVIGMLAHSCGLIDHDLPLSSKELLSGLSRDEFVARLNKLGSESDFYKI